MGQHASANAHMPGRLPRASWAVRGRKLRRLLMDPPPLRTVHPSPTIPLFSVIHHVHCRLHIHLAF
jgi:hypothetical protein